MTQKMERGRTSREEEEPRPPAEDATTRTEDDAMETSSDERISALEAECEELRSHWKRAQADYQNLRRRTQAEYELGLKRAMLPLLDELLLVWDYLDMALAAKPVSEEARNLATGIEMTRAKLVQALEREEVRPIPEGGTFDPDLHLATGTEYREGVEPGTILRTVRKGFAWRDGVLRHAHVIVATDAPGESSSAERESGEES